MQDRAITVLLGVGLVALGVIMGLQMTPYVSKQVESEHGVSLDCYWGDTWVGDATVTEAANFYIVESEDVRYRAPMDGCIVLSALKK